MFRFFNKNSLSFIANFFLFLFVSIGFLLGVSAYAEGHGVDVSSAVVLFWSGL